MIDVLRTSDPMINIEGMTRKSEESVALTALTCGMAESASVYTAAANSDVSIF